MLPHHEQKMKIRLELGQLFKSQPRRRTARKVSYSLVQGICISDPYDLV
jgi:hypothetical protein